MAAYDKCQPCSGRGYFKCDECICKTCQSNGKVKCDSCDKGKVDCTTCAATGQIEKKGWVFTHRETCPECRGTKRITCSNCKGKSSVTCLVCGGTGRSSTCSQCGATQRINCQVCGGSGKVESQWLKSLNSLPVDRLRFEHEKRQREISNLQIQVNRLAREEDDAYDDYVNGTSHSMDRTLHLAKEKGNRQSEISDLEGEIEAIERVINLKWK